MTQLVEQGHNLVVLQQRWLLGSWLAKIADQSSNGVVLLAILSDITRLQVEVGVVAILVVTGVKVKAAFLVILLLVLLEGANLLGATLGKSGSKVIQERSNGSGALGHFLLNAQGCVVVVTQKSCSFVTEGNDLLEERDIDIGLEFCNSVLAAGVGVNRIFNKREVMVVLEREFNLAFVLTSALLERVDVNVVTGNSLELLGSEPDGSLLFVEVGLALNLEFAQALLYLLESVSLGASRQTKPVSDKLISLLLENVCLLLDVLSHVTLDTEVIKDSFGLGGSVTELLVGGNMVVEGQDATLSGSQVLIYEDGLKDIGERGLVCGDIGCDRVQHILGSIAELLGVGCDRLGGGGEQRRRLRRVTILVGSHGATGVDGLEELVDLLVGHLLAQVCQDVLKLADADETRHILIKHLETAAVFLRLARVAETAGAVEDALECLEVDCIGNVSSNSDLYRRSRSLLTFATNVLLEVLNLGKSRVLATGAQKITEAVNSDTAVSALVEQGKSLLVVGRSLRFKLVVRHDCL
ncbi:hypothetical protein HG531_003386 [Fusarium graminearum]|nr:hypothetical protein HG531_003386 [Fusarium graminearum]